MYKKSTRHLPHYILTLHARDSHLLNRGHANRHRGRFLQRR